MTQELSKPKELPKEDLRLVIKGELQKLWDKHYKEAYLQYDLDIYTMYKLIWSRGRFILKISNRNLESSLGFKEELDDFWTIFNRLYRISPAMQIKWGCHIVQNENK